MSGVRALPAIRLCPGLHLRSGERGYSDPNGLGSTGEFGTGFFDTCPARDRVDAVYAGCLVRAGMSLLTRVTAIPVRLITPGRANSPASISDSILDHGTIFRKAAHCEE